MINDEIIRIKDKLHVFDMFHFEEEPHIYWWLDENGNRKQATTSMTALIHDHTQPFKKEEIAPLTARKLGLPVQEVLDMWLLLKMEHIKHVKFIFNSDYFIIYQMDSPLLQPLYEDLGRLF